MNKQFKDSVASGVRNKIGAAVYAPSKATNETAMARTPKHGWDADIDKRRAKKYLRTDVIPPMRGEEEFYFKSYITLLRTYGIRPRTTIKLLHDHFREEFREGSIDLKQVAQWTREIYTFDKDEPGSNSAGGDKVPDDLSFQTHNGKVNASNPTNIEIGLMRLGVKLSYNLFTGKVIVEGLHGFGPVLQDEGVRRLRFMLHQKYGFLPDKDLIYEFLDDLARRNSFDPVIEYFDHVQAKWDGTPRIERFLIDYAGADDSPYVRAVSKLLFVAVVRRNRQPGSKFDEMAVLEGGQGIGKSTAVEALAIRKEWFSDSFSLLAENRETLEHTQGKLIIEIAELQGMRKADIAHVKAMLARTDDRARLVWGRKQVELSRRFIFVGTSNDDKYLKDETGNRRFWPVAIKEFDLAGIRRDLDQLWGEAAALKEQPGVSIRMDPALYAAAGREQSKRLEIANDPFTDAFGSYLGELKGRITSEDAWKILGFDDATRRTTEIARRFGAALRHLGWIKTAVKVGGRPVTAWAKGKEPRRIVVTRYADKSLDVGYDDEEDDFDFG